MELIALQKVILVISGIFTILVGFASLYSVWLQKKETLEQNKKIIDLLETISKQNKEITNYIKIKE